MLDNSPTAGVCVLDRNVYPHIYEAVLEHAPVASLLRLRATCRTLRDWADPLLAPDLTISYVSSSRGVRVSSSTGFCPHFPTPVLRSHTQAAEWPTSAMSLFTHVLSLTTVVDLTETFPPTGLDPLPSFLRNVRTARIAVVKDGWSDMPRPPDLSGPIVAPEYILLGPSSWATMPGVRIPPSVERLVVNSPLHTPVIALDNIGRSPSLRECVFIFDARFRLDRSDPDFALMQQHQALAHSLSELLVAGRELQITLVNIGAVNPMTLGIAPAELGESTLEETLTERVRFHIVRQLGDDVGTRCDRLRFLTLDEYAVLRTPEQLALELGERE